MNLNGCEPCPDLRTFHIGFLFIYRKRASLNGRKLFTLAEMNERRTHGMTEAWMGAISNVHAQPTGTSTNQLIDKRQKEKVPYNVLVVLNCDSSKKRERARSSGHA